MGNAPPKAAKVATRATVLDTGIVKIPASVRNAVGIKAGSKVSFTPLPDGRIVMRVKSGTLQDLKGVVKTNRHATDAQIRTGQPGTIYRDAKSGAFLAGKPGAGTTRVADKASSKTTAKKK